MGEMNRRSFIKGIGIAGAVAPFAKIPVLEAPAPVDPWSAYEGPRRMGLVLVRVHKKIECLVTSRKRRWNYDTLRMDELSTEWGRIAGFGNDVTPHGATFAIPAEEGELITLTGGAGRETFPVVFSDSEFDHKVMTVYYGTEGPHPYPEDLSEDEFLDRRDRKIAEDIRKANDAITT